MQGYPDVRKVLDVFGCIIECADYDDMAAVVHKGGEHSHTHNQVRCFTEVFALLGMPVEASGAANLSYAAGEAALARGTNGGGGVDVGHGGGSMDLNPTYDLSTTRQGGKVPVGSAQLLPAKVVAV